MDEQKVVSVSVGVGCCVFFYNNKKTINCCAFMRFVFVFAKPVLFINARCLGECLEYLKAAHEPIANHSQRIRPAVMGQSARRNPLRTICGVRFG
jgi:hypothetical protein